jgi:hypothetical protein
MSSFLLLVWSSVQASPTECVVLYTDKQGRGYLDAREKTKQEAKEIA